MTDLKSFRISADSGKVDYTQFCDVMVAKGIDHADVLRIYTTAQTRYGADSQAFQDALRFNMEESGLSDAELRGKNPGKGIVCALETLG